MDVTAEQYIKRLEALTSLNELEKIHRYFKTGEGDFLEDNVFMGVRMGSNFALAKEFVDMELDEIEKMLESPIHDVRVGALSIMGKQFNKKRVSAARRKELFDLYIRRSDRINTWDLVDLSGHHVVGGYLYEYDEPRDILYKLAKSKDWWERRIAIFATLYFVRKGELTDTFDISEILVHDEHDYVQKATGGLLREAGKLDQKRLMDFLDTYAATMPRVMLRYSIEHLTPQRRKHYLGLKDA